MLWDSLPAGRAGCGEAGKDSVSLCKSLSELQEAGGRQSLLGPEKSRLCTRSNPSVVLGAATGKQSDPLADCKE